MNSEAINALVEWAQANATAVPDHVLMNPRDYWYLAAAFHTSPWHLRRRLLEDRMGRRDRAEIMREWLQTHRWGKRACRRCPP
jgi:hypothetical protein